MSTGSYNRRSGFSLVEVLVTIGIISILMALVVPAVQRAREAARRVQCQNQIKQLALALQMHNDQFGALPSATEVEAETLQTRAWPSRILSFVEQQGIEKLVEEAYRSPERVFREGRPVSVRVPTFVCPSDPRTKQSPVVPKYGFRIGLLSYLGCSGTNLRSRDGVLYGNSEVSMSDIIDGTSNTILLGERPPSADLRLGWWLLGIGQDGQGSLDSHLGTREINRRYGDCPLVGRGLAKGDLWDPCSTTQFWSLHGDGANFAFADGSVRMLNPMNSAVFQALGTRNGGEVIDSADLE